MKRFALIFILVAAAIGLSATTMQLTNFVELLNALQRGEDVQMVAHLGRSAYADEQDVPTPDMTFGINIDNWEYYAPMAMGFEKGFIVFGETRLIASPLGEGYVHSYTQAIVMDDGSVELTYGYLDAATMEAVMDETFTGDISRGRNESSPFLFFQR